MTVVVVEGAPECVVLTHPSRVPNRLYCHSQRGLPGPYCVLGPILYARDDLREDAGSLRITGLHEHARYPNYEHDHGQHHDEDFGLAHATRIAPARSPKAPARPG